MRFPSSFTRIGVACTALLALPSLAAAQHSLTGRLVEQLPGGGAIDLPSIGIYRVTSDTQFPINVTNLYPCLEGGPTSCIDETGAFTASDLSTGAYLVRIYTDGTVRKSQSAVVSANTNLGDIQLIRTPFAIEVSVGEIPASGGSIPVTLRATTRWSVPTLPIVVKIDTYQESTFGTATGLTPTTIDFIWPAGLANTGVVPIAPLAVSPSDPAGSVHGVFVEIRLQSNPQVVIGYGEAYRQKQP